MTDKATLMKVKANLKKRQPKFIRQDAHKHKRVKQVWRKPKGLHSKMKDSRKGYRAKLQEGYHTPKAVRGLDKHGLKPTLVATMKELESLDAKTHSVILRGGLGGRKRLAIIEEAHKRKFTITNAKADAAAKIKQQIETQQKEKKERVSTRAKRHEELEKKAAHKKKDSEEKSAEERKEEENAEKEKVLHKGE